MAQKSVPLSALFVLAVSIVFAASSASAQTVKSEIQAMSGWSSCTVCAGAGGNGTSATFWMAQNQASPSLSGHSTKFFLGGSTPYSDALWWKNLGPSNTVTHFQYDVYFYLTTPQYSQALEFDVNHADGARWFIFGTECSIKGGGVWKVWDAPSGSWKSTGIACSAPSAFKWHHLTWQFYRDSAYTHFVSVTLDGVTHYVNQAHGTHASSWSGISAAFQMDGDYAQHDYTAWLDNVSLKYW